MDNFLEEYSKLLDDSKNHLSNEAIATYLNLKEQLSTKEKIFIEKHLATCSGCKDKYELIQKEDEAFDTNTNVFSRKSGNSFYWYAAAAMILVALGISYWLYFMPEKEPIIVKKEEKLIPDTSSANEFESPIEDNRKFEKDKPKYNQADFAANQTLENFVNRNIRSESGTKIISPANGDTVKIPVRFQWQSAAKEIELSIVDNKNKTVLNTEVSDKSYLFEKQVKPGRYYWKVFVRGKLELIGRFYVKAPKSPKEGF